MAEIKSVNELLNMKLDIPNYQRPYKWDIQNIDDLLSDITNAINEAITLASECGGTVVFEPGEYRAYTIELKSTIVVALLTKSQPRSIVVHKILRGVGK